MEHQLHDHRLRVNKKGARRPRTSDETVERVREAFQRSPQKSVRSATTRLQIPRSTIHKVLHKRLRFYASKIQLLQALLPTNRPKREKFAIEMLHRINDDDGCALLMIQHFMRLATSIVIMFETPHETLEMERDSPKINV